MKTILRIIIILLVASVVAGAFSLAVNNNSNTAGSNTGGQPITRPEGGDRDGGSIAGGLGGVLATILKLTGITILVLMLQKGFNLLGNRKFIPTRS